MHVFRHFLDLLKILFHIAKASKQAADVAAAHTSAPVSAPDLTLCALNKACNMFDLSTCRVFFIHHGLWIASVLFCASVWS